MSLNSAKILEYTRRTKTGRFCSYAIKTGENVKKHDCRQNHNASSKAMEPAVAVHLLSNCLNSNVKLSVYTGDDDSTTSAHIREKVPYAVETWTDTMHAKRSLQTRLINLSQRAKFTNSSTLSQKATSTQAQFSNECP